MYRNLTSELENQSFADCYGSDGETRAEDATP